MLRLWPFVGVLLVSCGHPASVAECELIVERIVELELQARNRGSPEVVQAEVEKTKAAVREATMARCVGRRITDAALQCVRDAQSSSEVVDDCFDGWR